MTNPNVLYSVTGRYMDGREVIGYHLVGEDGSQSPESKDRVIYLIGRGIITNMRAQTGANGEVIIRGKGINLNTLPVFDLEKKTFRNGENYQNNQQSATSRNNSNRAQLTLKYRITRRIMYRTQCIGYELEDLNGNITKKKREQVIQLAAERLVSNATVQKCTRPGKNVPEIILRGTECDLKSLPILIVNDQGKIIDPLADKSKLTIRSVYMKHAGVLHNNKNSKNKSFNAGDFIICNPDGSIDIQNRGYIQSNYMQDKNRDIAICDDYLNNTNNYSIEIFGKEPVTLEPRIVKSWAILSPIS